MIWNGLIKRLAFQVLKQLIKLLKDKFIKLFHESLQLQSSFDLKKENALKFNTFFVSMFPITLHLKWLQRDSNPQPLSS